MLDSKIGLKRGKCGISCTLKYVDRDSYVIANTGTDALKTVKEQNKNQQS